MSFPPKIGPYRIRGKLGEGGFSKVYLGEGRGGPPVAIKVHAFGEEKRFRQEATVMQSINHPGVVRVLDTGRDAISARLYTVMEYIPFPTLSMLLSGRKSLPVPVTIEILKRVALALDHVYRHSNITAHRDIKPANIFVRLSSAGEVEAVKVADFGIARFAEGMRTQFAMGDPEYLPPEQVQNLPHLYGAATDVYALGCTGYRMLAGRPPFVARHKKGPDDDDLMELASAHVHNSPPPLETFAPSVEPALCSVIDRCLQKSTGRRYPTMHDFIAALDAAAGHTAQPINVPGGRERAVPARPAGGDSAGRARGRGTMAWPLVTGCLSALLGALLGLSGGGVAALGYTSESSGLLWTGATLGASGLLVAVVMPVLALTVGVLLRPAEDSTGEGE